jgi:uncharacterized RDD family membrane protein YckC
MKCPKCQYIGFDSGDRCRNCGYEFSLSEGAAASGTDVDLPIQNGTEPVGPLADLTLNETPGLPLFAGGHRDPDAPLVAAGAVPRAPLAVRRAAPAPPRPRREPAVLEPRLALDTADLGMPPVSVAETAQAAEEPADASAEVDHAGSAAGANVATIGARLAGGALDVLLLGTIDLLVLYFTLRICDLTFAQTLTLPLTPLVAFLAMLNGGYLSAFVAASGQTIGKMAAGTRVVSADPGPRFGERVTFEQSVLRAAASVVSALPLGLGLLPALFGAERRALHDRLADTRVVKA